MKDLVELKTNT